MKSTQTITVLLAEDHEIVREGLRALLQTETDLEVVGEAANGRQAVELVTKLHPDVVVMDIAMPLLNGLEATRQILKIAPATRVLILSAHSDEAYVDQLIGMGAAGYLIKQTAAHILPKAIRAVAAGSIFFSPSIAKRFAHHHEKTPGRNGTPKPKVTGLTPREMEVLQLITEGKANKETAAELGIAIKTVEKHRQHLKDKLGIHDTAGLTRYAMEAGIIENSIHLNIV